MWWSGTVHAVLRGRDASTWLADRQRGSPLGLSYTLHGTQVSLRRSWRPRGARVEETFGTLGPQPNPPPDPQTGFQRTLLVLCSSTTPPKICPKLPSLFSLPWRFLPAFLKTSASSRHQPLLTTRTLTLSLSKGLSPGQARLPYRPATSHFQFSFLLGSLRVDLARVIAGALKLEVSVPTGRARCPRRPSGEGKGLSLGALL